MASPRYMTAGEYDNREGNTKIADVTLTNDQIISASGASGGDPVVLIPATEVLDYSGFPSSLPIVLKAICIIDTTAGAYTNVSGDNVPLLVYGSDWSLVAGRPTFFQDDGSVNFSPIESATHKKILEFLMAEESVETDNIQDNALAFVINNGLGAFQDGNPANTMRFLIHYVNQSLQ